MHLLLKTNKMFIFSVIDNMLDTLKDETPKKFAASEEKRTFILISTVMTWANTKPVDPVNTYNYERLLSVVSLCFSLRFD